MATKRPLSAILPGVGRDFLIQASEIEPAVVIGGDTDSIDFAVFDDVVEDESVDRLKLVIDALAPHGKDIFADLKQPTGIGMTASTGAGLFATLVASHVRTLIGETADGNTKTSVAHFSHTLPDNYPDGGDISVSITTKLKSVTGTGVANNGSDLDLSAYKQAVGAVGSDLVSTSAQVYAALDTWYTKTFVIDATGLVAGDVLNFEITARAIENDAGNGTLQSYIGEVKVLHDCQG